MGIGSRNIIEKYISWKEREIKIEKRFHGIDFTKGKVKQIAICLMSKFIWMACDFVHITLAFIVLKLNTNLFHNVNAIENGLSNDMQTHIHTHDIHDRILRI